MNLSFYIIKPFKCKIEQQTVKKKRDLNSCVSEKRYRFTFSANLHMFDTVPYLLFLQEITVVFSYYHLH